MTTSSPIDLIDLECRQIRKTFDRYFTAVDDVSFSIPRGSFFSILGPSGCGKTTLLRMLAGFEQPTSGEIFIKGKSVTRTPPNKRPVNMVFQHLALFPTMTVAENIAYGLRRRRVGKSEIADRVKSVLKRVGLPDSGYKKIDQLSGGQKQRIAIARCLVLNPDVLLLDEPLGALDLKLREHMKVELKQLQEEFGTTFVYITHDQSEALVMSDQVAVMNNGVFEQQGAPRDLYYQPQTAFVAGFVGESNRWLGKVTSTNHAGIELMTDSGLKLSGQFGAEQSLVVGDRVEVFVRPEAISLSRGGGDSKGQNRLRCDVGNVLFDGAKSQVLVVDPVTDGEITVSLPQTADFASLIRGEPLALAWTAEQTRCFRAEG
ncbi:ABC transporter ATP-binding protein [Motiliproteus sp. MSK22-1]|uniref:ABC transporter ATP-binding protein n=1 Tax=Motiliproteus sp. MSK22-1 TaxID=1897630 RepID=UPI000977F7D6|nr:ABC transporter ATP-binding protein [Motiliproteus sp. MSK22-1]OMH26582.1 spermidine/putrescine ABC transporter ATP-binding protein [Motiliproteus sp. MSK22-1]